MRENSKEGTLIANITVADPDNFGPKGIWQTHICQLLDSAQRRFKIASGTHALFVDTGELNYEVASSHVIVIKCTDSGTKSLSMTKSFVINVVDLNEAPLQITLSNNVAPENAGPSMIGQFASDDPDNERDVRQTFTYSLVNGNERNLFNISGSELKTIENLNYENTSSWHLVVRTTDNGGTVAF